MKNDPIERAIALLDDVDAHSAEGKKQIRKGLESKYALVTAKAARIAGDALEGELGEFLVSAFARLLARGSDLDKGCVALTAIARSLVQLDYDEAELFRRGMKHVQMEGTWGGSVDVASEFRAVCAMGLANSRDHRKLHAMVELLADREWPARVGAVRAIAVTGSDAASLLLRYKALIGDPEPDVLAECLTGLLGVDGGEAVPFVGRIAESKDEDAREAAIVALGASRRSDAVEWLKARFEKVADHDTKKCILLALVASRTEAAMDFALDAIRTAGGPGAALILSAMGVYRNDPRLRDQIVMAAMSRSDGAALLSEAKF